MRDELDDGPGAATADAGGELRRLPIIYLWDRVVVPIQGELTDQLADQLSEDVLTAIYKSRAKGLVIDLTGVWLVDSHLCATLSHIAAAALLMGAPTVLSGLSPEIAMTLQTMGVEFTNVLTALTLEQALTRLGLEVFDHEREDEDFELSGSWDADESGAGVAGGDAARRDGGARDGSGRDAGGRDATGRDAGGRDATGRDAGGRDATGRDAGGRDATGRDATGRDATGRDANGREGSGGTAGGATDKQGAS